MRNNPSVAATEKRDDITIECFSALDLVAMASPRRRPAAAVA
jgi:hypothetical protein